MNQYWSSVTGGNTLTRARVFASSVLSNLASATSSMSVLSGPRTRCRGLPSL